MESKSRIAKRPRKIFKREVSHGYLLRSAYKNHANESSSFSSNMHSKDSSSTPIQRIEAGPSNIQNCRNGTEEDVFSTENSVFSSMRSSTISSSRRSSIQNPRAVPTEVACNLQDPNFLDYTDRSQPGTSAMWKKLTSSQTKNVENEHSASIELPVFTKPSGKPLFSFFLSELIAI